MTKVTYAIGDIHGHMDLLTRLVAGIEQDIIDNHFDEVKIVFLGDYVDRGPKSKQVINYLMQDPFPNYEVVCLMGNHEDIFISAALGGRSEQEFYLYSVGGEQTLSSYKKGFVPTEKYRSQWDTIPQSHIDWLIGLPYIHIDRDAGYVFVHAGVFPGRAPEMQDKYECLWIRKLFLQHPNPCDLKVVHGHTPTHTIKAENHPQRINVDTHAYRSGVLTAVALHNGTERFISANNSSITHY